MGRIEISGAKGAGKAALVDDADFATLAGYRWYLNHKGYAVTFIDGRSFAMHRMVVGLTHGDGMECDHINGAVLDNRRANLRACTRAENQQNRGAYPRGSSRFRGVYWNRQKGKWQAQVCIGGKRHALGRFDSEEEAGAVARAFREEHMPFTREERSVRC